MCIIIGDIYRYFTKGENIMDQITAFIESIDFDAIITAITDFLATIDFQAILDEIMAMVSGLIG